MRRRVSRLPTYVLERLTQGTAITALIAGTATAQDPAPSRALVDLGAAYTGEIFATADGGLERRAAYLHNIDLVATVHLDAVPGWSGPHVFAYVLGNHGTDPSTFVGDAQVVSNIAADPGWTLFELWAEQPLAKYRMSVLGGLYDLNSEFDVTPTGSFFLNSSFGIGAEFGASGMRGPSIFPVTSLGLRVRAIPHDALYVQAGVFDGVPGDPSHPRRTLIRLDRDEGALVAMEIGLRRDPSAARLTSEFGRERRRAFVMRMDDPPDEARIAAGFWYYTARFPLIADSTTERGGSLGIYLLADRAVPTPAGIGGDLRCFARIGFADPQVNRFVGSASGGCTWAGVVPGRPDDVIGLGATSAFNGASFMRAASGFDRMARAETTIEAAYAAAITSFLAVQLDAQYVVHPGTRIDVPHALAVAFRGQLFF